jgi:hypothetical protein
MCRSVIGPHALNNWLMLTRRMSTPTVFLPESSEGHGVDGANSSESEGCLAEVKEVEEEAPYGQRYSFSLKRGLCTSVDDANQLKLLHLQNVVIYRRSQNHLDKHLRNLLVASMRVGKGMRSLR